MAAGFESTSITNSAAMMRVHSKILLKSVHVLQYVIYSFQELRVLDNTTLNPMD